MTINDHQAKRFSTSATSTGKTVEEVTTYLQNAHDIEKVEDIPAGTPFLAAMDWADRKY